jgi:hypothetical protein
MHDLAAEELEEAVELIGIPSERGSELTGIGVGRLQGPDLELKPVAEAFNPSEHAHRVAFVEARVEQVDVLPDARVDASGGIDELECQVRRAPSGAQALLARNGICALDDSVFRQLGEGAHLR